MIEILEQPIDYYINRLRNRQYFSFSGWSDAEWLAMMKVRIGNHTGAGQLFTSEIGDELKKALKIALKQENHLLAVPKYLLNPESGVGMKEIQLLVADVGYSNAVFYERDMVTDDLAATLGGLRDFIAQLQRMDVYLVGNVCLKGLHFLKYRKFFETETMYNFHQVEGGIDRVVNEILEFGKPGVYLTAVGMSDAVMITKLHGKIKNSFFIDVGSMFDCFVGQGGNREWRAKLYAAPPDWLRWINSNL